MKVLAVAPADYTEWLAVDAVVGVLTSEDTIVHSGSYHLGGKIDRVAKRTSRARRPRIEVQFPEIPKFSPEEAIRRNADQLVMYHRPNVVVYFGDDFTGEVQPVLDLAEKLNIPVMEAMDFVRARRQRV